MDSENKKNTNKFFTISKTKVSDDEERSITAYGSRPVLDRDGELIKSSAWNLDNFRKNPVLLLSHNYSLPPVGKVIWTKTGEDGLLFKAQFANTQAGQELFELYNNGFMNSFSVGFVPNDYEEPDEEQKKKGVRRVYTDVELLEISCVSVPSCPEALMERYYNGEIKTKDISSAISEIAKLLDQNKGQEEEQKEIENVEETKGTEDLQNGEEKDNTEAKGETGKSETEEDIECNCIECDPENGDEKAVCRRKPKKEVENVKEEGCNEETVEEKEIVTKPETTENYHRIPVDRGDHGEHKIRTITIGTSSTGIKALYCVTCKKNITYLFDINKFSMEEAREWVNSHKPKKSDIESIVKDFSIESKEGEEYKERWNKSLSKLWDVASAPSKPTDYESALYCRFLDCKVKDIYKTTFEIPSPLLGSYFGAFKALCSNFEYKDTRDIHWGEEVPPSYETIQLNSKTFDDFLVRGIDFYEEEGKGIILRFFPTWCCQCVSIITSRDNKEFNKKFLTDVHKWVDENNYLRNEKFNLNGEFITPDETQEWDSVILNHTNKRAMKIVEKLVNTKSEDFKGRGVLMIGPPGSGKTLSGKTLLNKTDKTFIWIAASDFGKFVRYGEEHKCIELTFSLARKLSPCIVFMEDIDGYLHGSDSKIFDHLKTELDGLRGNKGVVTILTSNYPEKLPDALLDRPGRFHDVLLYDLPDKELRTEMINKWVDDDIGEDLLNVILDSTEGYSGAHMRELVDLAKSIAEDEEKDIVEALIDSLEKLISQRELIATLKKKEEKRIREYEDDPNQYYWDSTVEDLTIVKSEDKIGKTIASEEKKGVVEEVCIDIDVIEEIEVEMKDVKEEKKDEYVTKSDLESFLEGLKGIVNNKEEKKEEPVQEPQEEIDVEAVKNCLVEILKEQDIGALVSETLQEEIKKAKGEVF